MIFYNGSLKPFEVEIGGEADEKWQKPGFLLGLTNARHALANPVWNSRTKDAIFSYEYSGLVYITAEQLEREEEKQQDQNYQKMKKIIENLDDDGEPTIIPIIDYFDHQSSDHMNFGILSTAFGITKDKLPNFYTLSALEWGGVEEFAKPWDLQAFPEPLNDEKKSSPEAILLWARNVGLTFKINLIR